MAGDLDVDRAAMRVKVLAALIRRLRAGATHREPTGAFEFHVGVECDFARVPAGLVGEHGLAIDDDFQICERVLRPRARLHAHTARLVEAQRVAGLAAFRAEFKHRSGSHKRAARLLPMNPVGVVEAVGESHVGAPPTGRVT